MLYSEVKERENRFITALKIVFPFLLLILILIFSFKLFQSSVNNYVLLTLLIPIYVYYIFYLIYNGFRTSLIDSTTKAFTRKEILRQFEKLNNKKNYVVVLLHLDNIGDINERYGVFNADKILRQLIERVNLFLNECHCKNVPIGRCGGGNFLVILKYSKKELKHQLTRFSKELKNKGIDNIEIKLDFSILEADYDDNSKNIIEQLFILLEENKKNDFLLPNIKPDAFETIVHQALKANEIVLKYQPSISLLTKKIAILEVLPKIYTKENGLLSRAQIERIVNYSGYEKDFDEKIFSILLDEITPLLDKNIYFSIDISPVTLRNNNFKLYLLKLFRTRKIDPKFFILELCEKNCYEDMNRFNEIIISYKESGFKIALTNFGGNNCGFEYIKHLPIDIVKFDIEFTKKIEELKYERILDKYLIFIKNLDIQSMIKFVDKESLFRKIEVLKPDYIQGFYIGKPKSLEQIRGELE
ncbi:MAG: GGDEF domain-containing protein [Sulfurospirillaceae bacterium]|nr:GGDEF domain-containing protein [Sulfurospirillaceae bacterium]MDD2825302.1 GGDEF domain-containing protein [Sulfurospirillaceae bacterium]